ncbi:hypothetical protein AAE478_001164 [Parahypoxylon ruwenzoriense]
MDRKQARKSRIEIPLSSKPRPYRPGDGPPLAPIGIVPENDSDAFILDKRVLPTTTANGELKLQMYYVVGWPDLPAARVTILATKVCDFVSPRALEEFEYKTLLERDEEEEMQEARAKKRKVESVTTKTKKTATTNMVHRPTTPDVSSAINRGRRGRLSKAELQMRRLAKQPNFAGVSNIEVVLPPASTSGPSLSTPQKKSTAAISSDVEDDEADPGEAIYKQLYGEESGSGEDGVDAMDIDSGSEEEEEEEEGEEGKGDGEGEAISLDGLPETISSASEIRSYAQTLWLNKDSTLFKRANGKLVLGSSTTHVPVPEVPRSSKQFPPPMRFERRPSTTPIPVPLPFGMDKTMPPPNLLETKHTVTPVPVPAPFKSNKEIPRPKSSDGRHSTTPIPIPTWPRPSVRAEPASVPPPSSKRTLQHYGFTPAGRSSGKWPSTSSYSADAATAESPLNRPRRSTSAGIGSRTKQKNTQKPKATSQSHAQEEGVSGGEQVWVVERLEGHKEIETDDGRIERYFKVRWEGNWPADQNPTWEPEENIAPSLVRRYLKKATRRGRSAAGGHKKRSSKSKGSQHPPMFERKYSSVAEAFAGGEEFVDSVGDRSSNNGAHQSDQFDIHGHDPLHGDYNDDGEGEDEERFVVAAEEKDRRGSSLRQEDLNAVLARDLASSFSHNHNHHHINGISNSSNNEDR